MGEYRSMHKKIKGPLDRLLAPVVRGNTVKSCSLRELSTTMPTKIKCITPDATTMYSDTSRHTKPTLPSYF